MTCYLRLHEALLGVSPSPKAIDWETVFRMWQQATTVADREPLLSSMSLEAIDIYDLPGTDLSKYCGLIISDRVDQEFLYQKRDYIGGFLDAGKVVVYSGGLFRSWLPGSGTFVPYGTSPEGRMELSLSPHPIFVGVGGEDLGSDFAYGHHPAPEGAETIVALPDGKAAVYLDRASTPGAILLHAGHTLLGYAAKEGSARRVVPQLFNWIQQEAQ